MTEVATVKPHLERRFHDQQVVVWHGPKGQCASELDGLDLSGVTTRAFGVTQSRRDRDILFGESDGARVQALNEGKRIIL